MKNDKMIKKECPDGNIRREFVQRGTRQVRFGLSSAIAGQGKRRVRNESIRHSSKVWNGNSYYFSLGKTKWENAISCKNSIRANVKRKRTSKNDKFVSKLFNDNERNREKLNKFYYLNNLLNNSLSNTPYNHDITFKGNVMNNFNYPIDIISSDDMDTKIINPLGGLIVILDALKTTSLTTDQTQNVFSALSALVFNIKEEATIMSARECI